MQRVGPSVVAITLLAKSAIAEPELGFDPYLRVVLVASEDDLDAQLLAGEPDATEPLTLPRREAADADALAAEGVFATMAGVTLRPSKQFEVGGEMRAMGAWVDGHFCANLLAGGAFFALRGDGWRLGAVALPVLFEHAVAETADTLPRPTDAPRHPLRVAMSVDF